MFGGYAPDLGRQSDPADFLKADPQTLGLERLG